MQPSQRMMNQICEERVGTIELLLITCALFSSVALSLIPSMRNRTIRYTKLPSPILISASIFFTFVSLLLSLIALILGWLRKISAGAFSAVLFSLIPALVAMPWDAIQHVRFSHRMRKFYSLNITYENFSYVRIGRPCSRSVEKHHRWADSYDEKCGMENCSASIFVRYFRQSRSSYLCKPPNLTKIYAHLQNRRRPCCHEKSSTVLPVTTSHAHREGATTTETSPSWWRRASCFFLCRARKRGQIDRKEENTINTQWHGTRIGHTAHIVLLRDHSNGVKSWWWTAVSSASWLVAQPSLARVSSRKDMIQVLVAVADIISIGDLVLDVSREYLQLQLKTNNGIQAATAATPAFVCNAIVKELGLEWGEISPNIIKKEYIYPKRQTEEYGLLLFMIAEKSGVFEAEQVVNENGDVVKDSSILPEMRSGSCTWRSKYRIKQKDRVSGRTILEELMEEEGAEDVFETRKKELVVKWLEGWDCFTSVEEIKKLKEKKEEEEKNKKEENEGRKERRFQIVESGTYNSTHTVP